MKPDFLKTSCKESGKMWRFRTLMNWYPLYFGTDGKILFWSGDSREVHLQLHRNVWTCNYVGTIFGGSMFAASDPFYVLMLHRILGRQYVVRDQSASVRFRKPGRITLYMRCELTDEVIDDTKRDVAANGRADRWFILQWVGKNGIVHAEIERLCCIADGQHHERRKGAAQGSRVDKYNEQPSLS